MKLAIRIAAIPGWDFQTAATTAKAAGYDGVELQAPSDASTAASIATPTNALFTEPEKVRGIFADSGVAIASVACEMGAQPSELSRVIETAAALDSTMVHVLRADAAADVRGFDAFAARVFASADAAAAAGITLLLENEPARGSVSRLWRAIDGINHPSVACCWNPENGRAAGELPLVSIPTLNSRIRMAQFGDVSSPAIPTQKILQRLAGIGFDGWLLVDRPSEDDLRDAQSKLRMMWTSLKPPHAASRTKTH
jgi:sugar phosphate isomerase/epimerase